MTEGENYLLQVVSDLYPPHTPPPHTQQEKYKMSIEKNVLNPIVFSIPTIASTNTKADIRFSEELFCASQLQDLGVGSQTKVYFKWGWEHSGASGLLWWLSCAS